jgi:hypothetical protein
MYMDVLYVGNAGAITDDVQGQCAIQKDIQRYVGQDSCSCES